MVNPDQTSPHVVPFFEDGVASCLDTPRSQGVIPQVEISESVAEKDAMERAAIELGGMDTGDTGDRRRGNRKHVHGTGQASHMLRTGCAELLDTTVIRNILVFE